MCNNDQHLHRYVFVCLFLFPTLLPCQGHRWSVEVKSYKSPLLPHSALPLHPFPLPLLPPHLSSRSRRRGTLGAPGSHSYLGPRLLLMVCRGSEAAEGNYSSDLIGIIILAGWQRWITQQDPATVGAGAEGGRRGRRGRRWLAWWARREREDKGRGKCRWKRREEHKMKGKKRRK